MSAPTIPTIDPNDEVIVKDSDGSWKVFTNGQMVALSQSAPAAVVNAPPIAPPRRPVTITPTTNSGRTMVSDVMPPRPVVVGPVQELRMSLDDYIRSDATPGDRVGRILTKISELETQDYSKRLEGISAWKTSDVYSLYILLGQESVLSGLGIEDTIAKRKEENKPYLSVEDFQAITGLNNKLRT